MGKQQRRKGTVPDPLRDPCTYQRPLNSGRLSTFPSNPCSVIGGRIPRCFSFNIPPPRSAPDSFFISLPAWWSILALCALYSSNGGQPIPKGQAYSGLYTYFFIPSHHKHPNTLTTWLQLTRYFLFFSSLFFFLYLKSSLPFTPF